MSDVRIGTEVSVRLAWQGYTTAVAGLVACRTPQRDLHATCDWQLTHEPTGAVVAYFDGPEQTQAAAARLGSVDWVRYTDEDRTRARALVVETVDELGGMMPTMNPRLRPRPGVLA